MLHLKFIIR